MQRFASRFYEEAIAKPGKHGQRVTLYSDTNYVNDSGMLHSATNTQTQKRAFVFSTNHGDNYFETRRCETAYRQSHKANGYRGTPALRNGPQSTSFLIDQSSKTDLRLAHSKFLPHSKLSQQACI